MMLSYDRVVLPYDTIEVNLFSAKMFLSDALLQPRNYFASPVTVCV